MKFIDYLLIILICTGIFGIYVSNKFSEPLNADIKELERMIGKFVEIKGKIKSLKNRDGNIFIKLLNREIVDVVIFKTAYSNYPSFLEVGKEIKVKGWVEKYKGRIQIVVQNVQDLEIL